MEKSKTQTGPTKLEAAMGWLDKRFPATETFEYHMSCLLYTSPSPRDRG